FISNSTYFIPNPGHPTSNSGLRASTVPEMFQFYRGVPETFQFYSGVPEMFQFYHRVPETFQFSYCRSQPVSHNAVDRLFLVACRRARVRGNAHRRSSLPAQNSTL